MKAVSATRRDVYAGGTMTARRHEDMIHLTTTFTPGVPSITYSMKHSEFAQLNENGKASYVATYEVRDGGKRR